jgi:hypothetical protein
MKLGKLRPRWGWLYAIFGLMLLLFTMESKMTLSSPLRIVVQLGVLAAVYFLADLWVGANMPFDRWS